MSKPQKRCENTDLIAVFDIVACLYNITELIFKLNMKITSTDIVNIELNAFIGKNYWALHTFFPSSNCESLKVAFEKALIEWGKKKNISDNVINEFYKYSAKKKTAWDSMGHFFDGTNIYITILSPDCYDPSPFLWMFGEIGRNLLLSNSDLQQSQELRIMILFFLGHKFEKIAKAENVSIEKLKKNSISIGNLIYKAGSTHVTTCSKFENWLQEQLPKDYPNICFVFNDCVTIGKELDILIPSLNLAFEINGISHYKPIYGMESLERTQISDRLKRDLCYKKDH
jgi:hypothetical protein